MAERALTRQERERDERGRQAARSEDATSSLAGLATKMKPDAKPLEPKKEIPRLPGENDLQYAMRKQKIKKAQAKALDDTAETEEE